MLKKKKKLLHFLVFILQGWMHHSLWISVPLHCAKCQMFSCTSLSTCTVRVKRSKMKCQKPERVHLYQNQDQTPQVTVHLSPPPLRPGNQPQPEASWTVCRPIAARELWNCSVGYPLCAPIAKVDLSTLIIALALALGELPMVVLQALVVLPWQW